MDLGIQGRRALVLGASQGLGQAIALALAGEGVNVVLAARSIDKLTDTAEQCRSQGVNAEVLELDLNQPDSVSSVIQHLQSHPVDILVSNSGGPPPGTVPGVDPAAWGTHFQAMVLNQIQIIEAALGPMRAQGWGRVLAVSSSGIQIPIPHLAISNTLRSSLAAYCKTLAGEVAADGVTVNLLLPGRVNTPRIQSIDQNAASKQGISEEQARDNSIATIPAGRYGRPDEFGAVAAFYASEQAGYLTGNQIRVDGGLIRAL